MKDWQDLVNCALFGTERKAWQVTSEPSPVGALLRQITAESPDVRVLHAAGVLSVYRRVGQLTSRSTNPRAPVCPVESLFRCGPKTNGRLSAMLNDSYAALIPTALAALAETGQRIPEELLPAFLELAGRNQKLREPVSAVAGARGPWLAAQNPDWSWLQTETAPPDKVELLWETAPGEQRMGLLHTLRQFAPGKAIALIAAVWDQEKAEQRAQLLSTLRTGLTMSDEPFLEDRLDDRSIVVRRAAANLLASLPDARFSRRIQERLRPLLQLESKGLLRRAEVLEVTLPETADAAMQRDGIRPQAGGQGGEKASLVAQMLALVPPAVWSRSFSRSPDQLLKAAAAGDWKELLWNGWMLALQRHPDSAWALAFLHERPMEQVFLPLLVMLPEKERDELLCQAAESTGDNLMAAFPQFPAPWSPRLTRIVLKRIRNAGEQERPFLCKAALAMLPALDPQAAADISGEWPPEMSELAAALQFKQNLVCDIRNRC